MFHDAPLEAVVRVHRHRQGLTPAALGDTPDEDEAARRIIDGYQLRRVADFLLAGPTHDRVKAVVPPTTAPATGCSGGATSSSGQWCCKTIAAPSGRDSPYKRVALQFPDELLGDAVAVVHCLSNLVAAEARYADAMPPERVEGDTKGESHSLNAGARSPPRPRGAAAAGTAAQLRPATLNNPHCPMSAMRLFVLADNTFGSCCPDEITAQHYMADCIVHFGDACMSRSTRLPVLYVHPVFHFSALVSDAVTGGDGARVLLDAEATVVLEVMRRVASAVRHRIASWWAAKSKATGTSMEEPCPVRARIAIVGTYPVKAIVQAAERRWSATDDSSLLVEWPIFEERRLSVAVEPDNSNGPKSSENAPAVTDSCREDWWLVNGVRFPRLSASSSPPSHEVQYLLFIGGVGSSALVHVLAAERYNQHHYSDLCREYLEWDGGADANSVPVVCVLDNAFGDTPAAKEHLQSVFRDLPGTGAAESVFLELTDAVRQWVFDTCAGGVAAALVTGDCMQAQQMLQRRIGQRAFNIESVRASSAIGILVASLAIEGYREVTQQLHQLIRAYGKRSYVIYVGHLNEFKLANFADTIDCFVAVACPYCRQSHFPEKKNGFMKPIVSPAEVLVALTSADDDTDADEQYGMAAVYTASLSTVLQVLTDAVQARRSEMNSGAEGTDASTQQRLNAEEERWASSGALVRTGTGSCGALVGQLGSQGALARLYEREYVGLDSRVGQTPIQAEVLEGKQGIARGYAKEREGQGGPLSGMP